MAVFDLVYTERSGNAPAASPVAPQAAAVLHGTGMCVE